MKKIRKLDPSVVTENAQLKALESVLTKTHEFFERKVRRWFSKQFSTPYMDTFNIPWEELLLHYYEASIENMPFNEVYDLAVSEYLPDFVQAQEEDDQAFADSLVAEQEATIKAKKEKDAKTAALTKSTQQLQANAATVIEKAQSISKALDQQTTLPKPKAMSLKFDDQGDPDSNET